MKRDSKNLQKQYGLTLIELLIVLGITAILASALGYAFTAELTMQRVEEARRADLDRSDATERQITRLLQGAKLTVPAESSPAVVPGVLPGLPAGMAVPAAQTTYFAGVVESSANELGCDRLTFTTTAPALPMAALSSTDDFETQQQARGPIGGLAEISLSVTPIGDASGRTGLFERLQQPSDGDPTQGGVEFLLDPQIERVGFQFWDGLEWVTSWSAASPPRLPQAVRVSYTLRGAPPGEVRVFDVPLPSSDVSAQSPQNTNQNTN
jgi:prepilin-type N-terminal cleavage/methylation domain-containing protein